MTDNAVANFYRENPHMVSSPFGGVTGFDHELLLDLFERLDIDLPGKRVLDIGCGRGFLRKVVTDAGGKYTGVDLVPNAQPGRLAVADAEHLPFPDASVDLAVCIDAYEHFPDADAVAREIRRVLTGDGVFFLSAPNYANVAGLVKRACESFGTYDRNTWAPFGRWQPQELEQFVTPGRVRKTFRAADLGACRYLGYGREVGLGLFPWIDHPRTPDAFRFRLQKLSSWAGGGIVRVWPAASLHCFYRISASET